MFIFIWLENQYDLRLQTYFTHQYIIVRIMLELHTILFHDMIQHDDSVQRCAIVIEI